MMKKRILISALLGMTLVVSAQIIRVPFDHPSIQAAIDSADIRDTVLVEEGTYFENINFRGKAITVASRFILDGDTSHISKTIIDGSQASNLDTASSVLMFSGEDTSSVLMGFSITGGIGTKFSIYDSIHTGGGGIFISGSGGKIIHNIIEGNRMEPRAGPDYYMGAGLFANVSHNHSVVIRNNLVRQNYASARHVYGGGLALMGGRIICENNVISYNNANASEWAYGGGIYYVHHWLEDVIEEVSIRNNQINHNLALAQAGGDGGGGGFVLQSGFDFGRVEFYNNVVHHNHTTYVGGGMLFAESIGSVYNNTVIDNTAASSGNNLAVLRVKDLKLYNNIIWSTGDEPISEFVVSEVEAADFYAFHNLIMVPFGSELVVTAFNNVMEAPVFAEASYELNQNSPGIGRAMDSLEVDSVMYYAPARDFYAKLRPDSVDAFADMGAFESPYPCRVFVPDTAFLQALIIAGVDEDRNGLIAYPEAEAISNLRVGEAGISDLSGIEAFINLDSLLAWMNRLTEIDLSKNLKLRYLNVWSNQLTELDLSANVELTGLYCLLNELTDLNVSNHPKLEELFINANDISTIDVSNNPLLIWFGCSENKLTSLDLGGNGKLIGLNCQNNQLKFLDVSKSPDLEELWCWENQLESLNVSQNTLLTSFKCQSNQIKDLNLLQNTALNELNVGNNELVNLDLSENKALELIELDEMPGLFCVRVWEYPLPDSIEVFTYNSPNIAFTTKSCSLVGLEAPRSSELQIYPNPTSDFLTIKTDGIASYSIVISSLNGQKIVETRSQNPYVQMDLCSLQKGIYMLTITSRTGTHTRKIIKF